MVLVSLMLIFFVSEHGKALLYRMIRLYSNQPKIIIIEGK